MKKILSVVVIVIFCAAAFIQINANPNRIIISLTGKSIASDKHELRYKVWLLGLIPIAEAVLVSLGPEKSSGLDTMHLQAQANSLPWLSPLFRARAILDSYVDMHLSAPILFRQKINIVGKEDVIKEAIYNQAAGVMTLEGVRRAILSQTQDPLSALFNVRRMDFNRICEFEMNLNTNQKNYILEGTARKKNLSLHGRSYPLVLLKVSVRRRDKNPYHKSDIEMLLLPESGNITVLVKVFSGGVFLSAKLIEAK